VKADVLPIEGAEHQAVQLLLPWHGNAMLSASEAARVEAHVAGCARCQADLAWQARLRLASASASVSSGAAPAQSPPAGFDRRWMALRAKLGVDEPASRPQLDAPSHRPSRRALSFGWSFVLAAQAGLIVSLVLAVSWPLLSARVEPYRGLGAGTSSAAANAIIVFRADSTEAQIRAALRAGDARLVGGPTVSDSYLLHLRTTDQATLTRLRAQAGVVRVESLEAEASR